MSLVRWDPFRELEEMSDRLNRLFGGSMLARPKTDGGKDAMTAYDWAPSVDIAESPEEFHIKVELPGVKKEDVKVAIDKGVLRIDGERKQEKEEKGKKFHRIERTYGSFLRTFTMPDNIDEAKIAAEVKDGILHVRLPKTEKAKAAAVEVKVN